MLGTMVGKGRDRPMENQFSLDELKQLCLIMCAYRNRCESEQREYANSSSTELKDFMSAQLARADFLLDRVTTVYCSRKFEEHPLSLDDLIL